MSLPVPLSQLSHEDALRTLVSAAARAEALRLELVREEQDASPRAASRRLVTETLMRAADSMAKDLALHLAARLATTDQERDERRARAGEQAAAIAALTAERDALAARLADIESAAGMTIDASLADMEAAGIPATGTCWGNGRLLVTGGTSPASADALPGDGETRIGGPPHMAPMPLRFDGGQQP